MIAGLFRVSKTGSPVGNLLPGASRRGCVEQSGRRVDTTVDNLYPQVFQEVVVIQRNKPITRGFSMSDNPQSRDASVADSSKARQSSTIGRNGLSTGMTCLAPGFSTLSTDLESIWLLHVEDGRRPLFGWLPLSPGVV